MASNQAPEVQDLPAVPPCGWGRAQLPEAGTRHASTAGQGARQCSCIPGSTTTIACLRSSSSELDLPRPDINLGVGSGSHAVQTAAIMVNLESTFETVHPDWSIVYGDINSTIAARSGCVEDGHPTCTCRGWTQKFRHGHA